MKTFKTTSFVLLLLCANSQKMYAEQNTKGIEKGTQAICQAVISVPANYTQLQTFVQEGSDLHCNCLVRQRTQFIAMDKTIVKFYDPIISEYTLEENANDNTFIETIEVSPLYIALSREDKSLLKVLIQNGVDINRKFKNGMLPIEYAMYENKQEMVQFLLNRGAHASQINIGCPHNLQLTKQMIRLGANPMTIDLDCAAGNPDRFQEVLSLIPNFTNRSVSQTELIKLFNNPQLLKTMLGRGLNINEPIVSTNQKGEREEKTLLIQAIENDNESAFDLLLNHGAYVNSNSTNGWTPIFYAVQMNSLSIVKKLIDKGASVTWISENQKDTPLTLSVELGFRAIAKLLLDAGAKPYLRLLDKADLPLTRAFRNSNKEIINLLLNYTSKDELVIEQYFENQDILARPETLNLAFRVGLKGNDELLRTAILMNNTDAVGVILKNSPKWNPEEKVELPAIYQAFENNNTDIVTHLIKKGADLNLKIEGKNPLLIQAINKNSLILVVQLINNGANSNMLDTNGISALQTAINNENYEIIKFLINRNVGINCSDILLAIEKNDVSTLKLMQEEVGKFDCKIDGKSLKYHTRNQELSYEVKNMVKGNRWF